MAQRLKADVGVTLGGVEAGVVEVDVHG